MADKTIGELPAISSVADSSLIPVEQAGAAGKMTGAQFRAWAQSSVQTYVESAESAAEDAIAAKNAAQNSATGASNAATAASTSANTATAAKNAILDMNVAATTLDPGSQATISKTTSGGVVTLTYGIPAGATGEQGLTGPEGPQGPQGPKGDTGTAVAVETQGLYYFNVDNDSESQTYGHLFLTYTGEDAPSFEIDTDPESDTYQHLVWVVPDNENE